MIYSGVTLSKLVIFTYNETIIIGYQHMLNYMKGVERKNLQDIHKIIPKIHHNNNLATKLFRGAYAGQSLYQLGVIKTNIQDLNINSSTLYQGG